MKKKINLFIIGTHKSGTTTLVKILNQHHDVFIPEKEMHYFERDFIEQRLKYATRINKHYFKKKNILFDNYIENYMNFEDRFILGDKSPSYLYSQTSASEIFNYNPSAKIIVIFREPYSFLQSLHSQNLFNLIEIEKNFNKAFQTDMSYKKENYPKRSLAEIHMLNYKERIKYAEQLKRFLYYFDRKQMLVLLNEELNNNFQTTMKRVYDFLDIEYFDVCKLIANKNKKVKYKQMRLLINYFASFGIHQRLFSEQFLQKLKKKYNSILLEHVERSRMSSEVVRDYKILFKTEVSNLIDVLEQFSLIENPTGLLKLWGYNNI